MVENRKIECPFCDEYVIDVSYTPSMRTESRQSFGRSHTKSVVTRSKEKYEVLEDCPKCGVSASKIEKVLNSGQDYKKPSRESVLERMKKAGLPTRI